MLSANVSPAPSEAKVRPPGVSTEGPVYLDSRSAKRASTAETTARPLDDDGPRRHKVLSEGPFFARVLFGLKRGPVFSKSRLEPVYSPRIDPDSRINLNRNNIL